MEPFEDRRPYRCRWWRRSNLTALVVAMPILFKRLPGLRLAGRPSFRNAWHFHGLEALPVKW